MNKIMLIFLALGALAANSAFAGEKIYCVEKYKNIPKYGNVVRVRTLEIVPINNKLMIVTAIDDGERLADRAELTRGRNGVYEGFANNAFEGSMYRIQFPKNTAGTFRMRVAYYNSASEGDPLNGAWEIFSGCRLM